MAEYAELLVQLHARRRWLRCQLLAGTAERFTCSLCTEAYGLPGDEEHVMTSERSGRSEHLLVCYGCPRWIDGTRAWRATKDDVWRS